MNNEVNTLFRSYNDLDLVKAENILLESETKLNDKERKILMHVFSAFKKNKFQDRNIVFSIKDICEDDLIQLQDKRVILINIDRKEYVLTMVQNEKTKGTNAVVVELDDMVCEYFRLFPSNYLN